MSSFYRIPLYLRVKRTIESSGLRHTMRKHGVSTYIEIYSFSKVILVRISDHKANMNNQWPPDYDITDRTEYSRFKKALKKLVLEHKFKTHIKTE